MENKQRFRSLTRSHDFQQLKVYGITIHINSWLLVNVQKTQLQMLRCGWTVPRQVGPATLRNRFRRWGREYLRKWAVASGESFDMNLVFKRKTKEFYQSVRHKDFDEAMDKMVLKLRHIRE